ncbi:hypothetical protein [Paenibacillus sp. PAMC21692]|uniref:hypothetical protein n=1 Tax=Paenibacillus sp. PAMC21692 TaxID=2762320 RepID=UPI00164E4341|nr:hypothetical protein [Paenibacillus sp. PAMC21692]QNK58417.1 hypothetical protein H7F31_05680 [Paenibacillus sp. PAMC21692]
MTKMFKKSLMLTLMAMALVLAMAASAFAATESYEFHYGGSYHSHSSSYISGPADVTGGQVTIKLTGNYFPEIKVGSTVYYGSYDTGTNLTTFVFPGSASADIPLELKVVAGPHNMVYNLTLVWL